METRISRNIKTFGLNENQHELAITMVRDNAMNVGNYYLDETDPTQVDIWIENKDEYSPFLKYAKDNGAEIYTFSYNNIGAEQVIGYVAVYDEDLSTQNNDILELEYKLIKLVNLFDDVNESLRHFASRLLMDTSEDNQMDVYIVIETDEDQGLSDLEKPTVTKIYQDPSEGIIWVLFEGTEDYVEWDVLTYSDQYQILKYLQEEM